MFRRMIIAAACGIGSAFMVLRLMGTDIESALVSCALGGLIVAGGIYTLRKRIPK